MRCAVERPGMLSPPALCCMTYMDYLLQRIPMAPKEIPENKQRWANGEKVDTTVATKTASGRLRR